jgi:hypothetical protein
LSAFTFALTRERGAHSAHIPRLQERVTVEAVASFLKGHADQVVDGLELKRAQLNLGARTGRKPRWVFKILRPEGYDAAADLRKAQSEAQRSSLPLIGRAVKQRLDRKED